MAKADATPQTHLIQRSPEQVACTSCDVPIEEGEPRFSEAVVGTDGKFARSLRYARTPRPRESYDDDDRGSSDYGPTPDLDARYYHLECAAKHVPFRLRTALAQSPLALDNRDQLQASIDHAIEHQHEIIDPAAANAATRAEYERFVAQARDADDDECLIVFGDWLQTVGDPRGELVALQVQIETATGWTRDRLVEAERKLLASHGRELKPSKSSSFGWRRGFVHRLDLRVGLEDSLDNVLKHPSLQLVRELACYHLPEVLPSTLRSVELEPIVANNALVGLDRIPGLRRLVLHLPSEARAVIESLAVSPALPQLRELVIHAGELAADDLAPLRDARLALLDLRATKIRPDEALRSLAATVELPAPPVEPRKVEGPWRVRHTKRPEWGTGRVIEETEEGIRVEFETGGEKLIRNADVLEDVS